MKTTLLLLILFFISVLTVDAQITYDDTLGVGRYATNEGLVRFKYAGDKYWMMKGDSIIELYHLNHTLYKSIIIPNSHVHGGNTYSAGVYYLSETLFDSDSSTIEYMFWMEEQTTSAFVHLHIYDELGNTLFFLDSCMTFPLANAEGFGFINKVVFNTDSGTKMMLRKSNGGPPTGPYLIYNLPGTLYTPCDCYDSNGQPLVVEGNSSAKSCMLKNYPNPSGDKTIIEYRLPKNIHKASLKVISSYGTEIKTYTITDAYSTIELDNSDLPQGNYFYQVILPDGKTAAKRMMVIR
jgi:hypothetical protein